MEKEMVKGEGGGERHEGETVRGKESGSGR